MSLLLDSSEYSAKKSASLFDTEMFLKRFHDFKKIFKEKKEDAIHAPKIAEEREYKRSLEIYADITNSDTFFPPLTFFRSHLLFQTQEKKLKEIKAKRSYPDKDDKGLLYVATQYQFKNFQFLKQQNEKVDVALEWDPMSQRMKGVIIFGDEEEKEYCTGSAVDELLCKEIAHIAEEFGIDCHFQESCVV